PEFVAGHSIGEVAAAHVAGVFSLADACTLVSARGRLMQALPTGGAMLAVQAAEDEVLPLLGDFVSIAAVNGPTSVVVSGAEEAVAAIEEQFADRRTTRLRVSHAFHSPLMDPMLEDFRTVLNGLTYQAPTIPVVSNLTGGLADSLRMPDYWVRHVREAVRFADGIRTLHEAGVRRFLELGPDAVLTALTASALSEDDTVAVPALRKDRPEEATFLQALAGLHVHGTKVDWRALLAGAGRHLAELPTYPFEHREYWPTGLPAGRGAESAGLRNAEHPVLTGSLELAGSDGLLFTGRLSARTHAWVADHVVMGSVLVPGTALVELAVRAGDEVGCDVVEELTLATPLVLPGTAAVQLQVVVGVPDDAGRRPVAVHSRPAAGGPYPWTLHASGVLGTGAAPTAFDASVWPPADAEQVDLTGLYDGLAETGFGYGPAFQGLRAVWRRGEELFADVSLPEGVEDGAYGLHPALFDACLHTLAVGGGLGEGGAGVPFAWGDVELHASGASALRVRLAPSASGGLALTAADVEGRPVASVGSLIVRPIAAEQLGAAARPAGHDALFRLDWVPVQVPVQVPADGEAAFVAVEANAQALAELAERPDVPSVVLTELPSGGAESVHTRLAAVLDVVRTWLARDGFAASRLVFVTRGAVSGTDLAGAAAWGLVRSAASEEPGRFGLLDLATAETELRPSALTVDEPQLLLRDGELFAARIVREEAGTEPPTWPTEGSVLVTGGTGGLGRLVARHLAAEHGVRSLLLVSRSGAAADGVADLVADLAELGAETAVEACDVADPAAVTALFARHDIRAVVHTAGVLDDGTIGSLTPERVSAVLRPKADAAWNLHRATEGLDLTAFVLFSSAAGTLGNPGQANYAAANAFLDALARHRRSLGLRAVSLAWGPWTGTGGMTGTLTTAEAERLTRAGMPPLTPELGLALFDVATAGREPVVLPLRLDRAALRQRGEIPPLLGGLVRMPVRRGSAAGADGGPGGGAEFVRRLSELPRAERREALLEAVRRQVAAVLGHAEISGVDPQRAFQDLGLDSLTAVELRNRLGSLVGLRLPATLVFDHPTVAELAEHLFDRLGLAPEPTVGPAVLLAELDRLEQAFGETQADEDMFDRVAARLEVLRAKWLATRSASTEPSGSGAFDFESASDDEMFDLLDNELGLPD
ncbi:SDR family NAD(P)-dependent oxidoreductase, partial [Kitasatospora sp. NPDC048545]|uniref:type I polyketide synthase n=1 Tax=Kitasatospora sp. NPDC048545 TaxID=3157208 RepID=UPI0033D4DDFD